MNGIVYSRAARADRRSITAFAVEHFGFGRARRLRARLEKVLLALAASPLIGRSRRELDPTGCSFRYCVVMKRFVVVHQPTDAGIHVARILHGDRDLLAELERGPGNPQVSRAAKPARLSPIDFTEDRLANLVRLALVQETISLGRAAEILGLSLVEMRALAAAWVA